MNIATFRPRQSTVLVRRLPIETKDTGGIIIPGAEFGQFAFAQIVAIGPGNATVSHMGRLHPDGRGDGNDTRFMGDTADLAVDDLVILKVGTSGNALQQQQKRDFTLPFTVAGEKVELVGEGMIVAVITKDEEKPESLLTSSDFGVTL